VEVDGVHLPCTDGLEALPPWANALDRRGPTGGVLVLGDAHADDPDNREALLAAYEAADADVALQVGDLRCYSLPAPTYFVAGNNEEFDVIDALRRGDASLDGVAGGGGDSGDGGDDRESHRPHLLASTAVEVEGVRVAGLSGNYAPTQYDKSRDELAGDRRRHFVRDDVERTEALGDVDVLLVHEAPHGLLYFGYDPGSDPIDDLLDALRPDRCLVGHYHRHAETERDGTRVVALAPAWESYYTLDPDTLELDRHDAPTR
jgi:predicted phosphodiesterase